MQVGLVQFRNMAIADCGAGSRMHAASGKDNGAAVEISWVIDDRSRWEPDALHMHSIWIRGLMLYVELIPCQF